MKRGEEADDGPPCTSTINGYFFPASALRGPSSQPAIVKPSLVQVTLCARVSGGMPALPWVISRNAIVPPVPVDPVTISGGISKFSRTPATMPPQDSETSRTGVASSQTALGCVTNGRSTGGPPRGKGSRNGKSIAASPLRAPCRSVKYSRSRLQSQNSDVAEPGQFGVTSM